MHVEPHHTADRLTPLLKSTVMRFERDLPVCNPSPYPRDDYVEVDLDQLTVPDSIPDDGLRLYRMQDGKKLQAIPFQVDYPFGRNRRYRSRRVMTFFSQATPPGSDDYRQSSATYRLEQADSVEPPTVTESPLGVEHFYSPSECFREWDQSRSVSGVKLSNSNRDSHGLEVYFSLVPRPEDASPINYSGAATSVYHCRLGRSHPDCPNLLSPFLSLNQQLARCGQLTRLDFYPLPWEPRWYHTESFLEQDHAERSYALVWSQAGPCRATVTLASEPFVLAYAPDPTSRSLKLRLTCRLYRVISLFPWRESYSEQLLVRAEECPDASLAFRAHFQSYVDAGSLRPRVARLESIPDYFAVWWRWTPSTQSPLNLGYAVASDSHIRSLNVSTPEITWALQLGHEHRTMHCFLYEPHQHFDMYHTVGHDAWYQGVFKRLEVLPYTRYPQASGADREAPVPEERPRTEPPATATPPAKLPGPPTLPAIPPAPPLATDVATDSKPRSGRIAARPSPQARTQADIAIVTVLPEEYVAVLDRLEARGVTATHYPGTRQRPNQGGWVTAELVDDAGRSHRVVVAVSIQPGQTRMSDLIHATQEEFRPRWVILVGIAGGFPIDGLAKGDIAIADVIYDYEYGKIGRGTKFQPRHNFTYQVDRSLLRSAESLHARDTAWTSWSEEHRPAGAAPPKLFSGPIASGNKVVDDATNAFFKQVRRAWPKLIAIEMEGAGAASAIDSVRGRQNVGFLMVRGISDMPRTDIGAGSASSAESNQADRDRWKRYAAAVAADFTIHWISRGWPMPPRGSR